MSIQIKYKNIDGQELTPQQFATLNDDYSQEQYINDKLKRVDYYMNGRVNWGAYYLDCNESILTVVTSLGSVWANTLLFLDEQILGEYTVRNWEFYNGINKLEKGKTVYDSLNREICEVKFDIDSLEIIEVSKKYYLETFGSFIDIGDVYNFGTFVFNYDNPGRPFETVRVWIYLPGFEHKEYYITNEQNELLHFLITPVFVWADHPYYHSSSPSVPSSTV